MLSAGHLGDQVGYPSAYIAVVDPDLLAEFATDVGEARLSVEAGAREAAAAQHLDYLGIFLAFLLEAMIRCGQSNIQPIRACCWRGERTYTSSRFSLSLSFLPLLRFFPPCVDEIRQLAIGHSTSAALMMQMFADDGSGWWRD